METMERAVSEVRSGRSMRSVAREFGLCDRTLANYCKKLPAKLDPPNPPGEQPSTSEQPSTVATTDFEISSPSGPSTVVTADGPRPNAALTTSQEFQFGYAQNMKVKINS
jgi:hypothetical protein